MYKVYQHLITVCLLFTLTNSAKISSCIPNTPCKCLLTAYSFTLINCSYSLPDLPIFKSNTSINITKILARNALIRWPLHLCKYSNIQILDLSDSYFNYQSIDLSCLSQLIHLNLSHTQLKQIPNFQKTFLKNLQILDLSNNQIEILNGSLFRSLNNLKTLFIQNNPLKQIDYFEHLLSLSRLEFINLISSNLVLSIKKPLTASQWFNLAHKWNNSNKSFLIRTNTIPLQSIFPQPDQFRLIPLDSMAIILKILANSTFSTLFSTPKCNCVQLQAYQRVFSFVNDERNLSPLFQSSTCLMPNGIVHARLFDRRTLTDLNCLLLGKTARSPIMENSCSLLKFHLFIHFVIIYLFYQK